MKKLFTIILCVLSLSLHAEDSMEKDTLFTEIKQDFVVLSSTKETNSLKSLPASVSVLSPKNLEGLQIRSLKDLSAIVPNFYTPSYGSKMTSALYIRGIGARTGTQTVSMYVDNIPYFNPSVFDSELYDIQRIEVLRGTQGTLYGRNSMGGIINIYTFSPLTYNGINANISGGNYGFFSGNLSCYGRLTDKLGVSVSGYYKRDDGFFKNEYNGKRADDLENAGGRIKVRWEPSYNLAVEYSGNFDFNLQGAFPYMKFGEDKVNYDGLGSYKRRVLTNGLSVQYTQPQYIVTSITGYQYLNDNMDMDQDYTPAKIFKINQKQNQHSLSEEITIKSNNPASNYQWSNGIYGFYDYQKITSPVLVLQDGITAMLQPMLDRISAASPNIPFMKFTDSEISLDGLYRKPAYGGAIFHQSTFNNVLTKGLSFTAGLRIDYEKTELKYDANAGANMTYQQQTEGAPVIPARRDTTIIGKASKDFVELLPKFVVKYDLNPDVYFYASASRGYKTGGHNVQLFAELLQSALINKVMGANQPIPNVGDALTYNPEYSWNYEVGGKADLFNKSLSVNFSVFFMDVKDVQISQFAETGAGRMTTNAGKAQSKGFELGVKTRPCTGFFLYANYGYANAKFKSEEYYKGNHIPFAPRSTISIGTNISYAFKRKTILDRITFDTNFSGIDKIYWTEENNKAQQFYGTVNARLNLEKSIFNLEFWGKNIFDRDYQAFYFESMGNSFVQKGKPAQWGVTLRLKM